MSSGVRLPLAEAEVVARDLVNILETASARIEIAGSIRRRRSEVGDIEIVAAPRFESTGDGGLWGDTVSVDLLAQRLDFWRERGILVPREVAVHRADGTEETSRRVGERYQALVYRDMPVDLFIVRPPAEWGVVLTIRTGPAEWSQRLVTDCQRRFNRVSGGQLLHLGKPVPCPEERDFLTAIGQRWIDPPDRSAALVQLP